MADNKIIHVVGTGTIGEPLIGLLCDMKEQLGFSEITFHKRTPLIGDRPKIKALLERGAKLAVDKDMRQGFSDLGIEAQLDAEEALEQAEVVIDCTPAGNENKEKIYKRFEGNTKGFIAQGSEFGFGKMYARGINDSSLSVGDDKYVQVVSCNTHNISLLIHCLVMKNGKLRNNLKRGRFTCMRRANDISQEKSFLPSPQAGKHDDPEFGTHHARDAFHLFETMDDKLDLFSSAMKLNTQYMHMIQFNLELEEATTLEEVKELMAANPRVSTTEKRSANMVFSFGRDNGHYGRILTQTVICMPSLHLGRGGKELTGFCFTPQDGNSLLSSLAIATWMAYPEDYEERIQCVKPFMFKEV